MPDTDLEYKDPSNMAVVDDNPLANLSPEMLERIKKATHNIQNTSTVAARKISVVGGGTGYRLPDDTVVDSFSAIIVGVKHANRLYTKPYVQGKPEQAECVAVDTTGNDVRNADLIPIESCRGKFADSCATCHNFEWGSNPTGSGKGKLCTEYVLCAVLIPSMGDDLYIVEQKKARSQKMDSHVKKITNRFGHPVAVYTQFKINEGNNPFEQNFYATDYVPGELVEKLVNRFEEADAILTDAVINSLGDEEAIQTEGVAEVDQKRAAKRKAG